MTGGLDKEAQEAVEGRKVEDMQMLRALGLCFFRALDKELRK